MVIEDHPHGPLPDFRRIGTSSRLALLLHCSILSTEGAVTNPGAVHSIIRESAENQRDSAGRSGSQLLGQSWDTSLVDRCPRSRG
jgi:hypothetical protein